MRMHIEENLSVFAISILLDVSEPWIRERLKETGIEIKRIRSVGIRHAGPISRKLIRDLYKDEFLTVNQIGLKLGLSRNRILNVLNDFGLELPEEGTPSDELDELPSSLWRCFDRRSPKYRTLVQKARKRGIPLQVKHLGGSRVWIAREGKFLHGRYKAMRPHVKERRQSIETLYKVDKLSGSEIAGMYQVSEFAIFHMLSGADIVRHDTPRFRVTKIERKRLERLYLHQRLSVPQIATKLKIGTRHIVRELVRHGIWSDSREITARKFPGIEDLNIGDSMTIKWNPGEQTYLSRESQWFNIRVVFRHIDDDTVRLIRTPHFTVDEVVKYHDKGFTTGQLAKLFFSNRPKVLKLKREAQILIKPGRQMVST